MIRDHARAQMALTHVRAVKQETEEQARKRKAYGAACHKLPILVHQEGLAVALHHLATLRVAGGYKGRLLDHLADQAHAAGLIAGRGRQDLLAKSRSGCAEDIISLSREVQRSLEWYKRFATMELKVSVGEGDDDDGEEAE